MGFGNVNVKPDYAKFSLYLGVVSVIGAGAYWYWQFTNKKAEQRYHAKYLEVKSAIKQVQLAYGLVPTGRLDEATKTVLSRLKASTEG
jgi:Putative peptidoglycan binding domain